MRSRQTDMLISWIGLAYLAVALGACVQSGPKPPATDLAAPVTISVPMTAADSISQAFATHFPRPVELSFKSFDYDRDPNLKDVRFGKDWQIERATLTFHHALNAQNVFFSLTVHGRDGKRIEVDTFNIMNLVPKLDMAGRPGLVEAEMLLEEFERFGVAWKSHLGEFRILGDDSGAINRVVFQNNCLDPGKWELQLMSKYYRNAAENMTRKSSPERYRKIAHGWTLLPMDFYQTLIRIKNPKLDKPVQGGYVDLSRSGGKTVLPPEFLPNPAMEIRTGMVELGLESERDLEMLNEEQFQKRFIRLVDNREDYHTYADIVREPVRFAAFEHEGLYTSEKKKFDFRWMKAMNRLRLFRTSEQEPVRWVDLEIGGEASPYRVVLKNLDLGNVVEGGIYHISFGFDPPPTLTHQYNSRNPNGYKLGGEGKVEPVSLLCSNQKTGAWQNNQDLGLEKLMMQWESPEKEILWVFLVSFERMIPVWMGRVRVEDASLRRPMLAVEEGQSATGEAHDAAIDARRKRDQDRMNLSVPDTVTLAFEDLAGEGPRRRGYRYVETGFELTSSAFLLAEPFYSKVADPVGSPGSTFLVNGSSAGINVLKKIARVPAEEIDELHPYFRAVSIRLAESRFSQPTQVTFVGVLGNEVKVVQTFELDGRPGAETFRFDSRFQNIKTLRWYGNSVSFDDIVVANLAHATL
jgi:hypothetical protein